jgi:hypothetical protein
MEGQQLVVSGQARLQNVDALVEAARLELTYEGRVPIRTKGVAVTETVTSQTFAQDHCHRGFHVGARAFASWKSQREA